MKVVSPFFFNYWKALDFGEIQSLFGNHFEGSHQTSRIVRDPKVNGSLICLKRPIQGLFSLSKRLHSLLFAGGLSLSYAGAPSLSTRCVRACVYQEVVRAHIRTMVRSQQQPIGPFSGNAHDQKRERTKHIDPKRKCFSSPHKTFSPVTTRSIHIAGRDSWKVLESQSFHLGKFIQQHNNLR